MNKKYFPIIFFAILSILIIWQMLLPGYILALDFSITPFVYPEQIIIKKVFNLFYYVSPPWAIQKILLFSIFFFSGYLAYISVPVKNIFARYYAGLLYAVNPFIYSRFLAGHFIHLLAYAVFPFYIKESLRIFDDDVLYKQYYVRNFLILLFIWMCSPHYFAIYLIFLFVIHIVYLSKNISRLKGMAKSFSFFFAGILGLMSYYFLPNGVGATSFSFDIRHFEIFKSAADKTWGLFINLFGLYGFWSESMMWGQQFIWPKNWIPFWSVLTLTLLIISLIGFFIYTKKSKRKALVILAFSIFGYCMAVGYAAPVFRQVFVFLGEMIPLFKGFRESHKWIIFLIYFYLIGSSVFFEYVLAKIRLKKIQFSIIAGFFLLPLLLAPTQLFGFVGQVEPVWYPQSWHFVREKIAENTESDEEIRTLVFPWHLYLKFSFNNNRIIANPAERFFPGKVIAGDNMEGGLIYSTSKRPESLIINDFMQKKLGVEEMLNLIRPDFIIYFTDQLEEEYQDYKFLFELEEGGKLERLIYKEQILLYKVK